MLEGKSLTQLRSIAQGYGVKDFFDKTEIQLRQAIQLKQQEMQPKPAQEPISVPYDSRLMTKPPSKITYKEELLEVLKPYIARGLTVTFPAPEEWKMQVGSKEDTGTMRQPIRNVLECATRILK